jgi:hypothetical protein
MRSRAILALAVAVLDGLKIVDDYRRGGNNMEKYLVINCHLDYEIYLMIVSISLERQRGHCVALISVCTSCDTYLFMVVSSRTMHVNALTV